MASTSSWNSLPSPLLASHSLTKDRIFSPAACTLSQWLKSSLYNARAGRVNTRNIFDATNSRLVCCSRPLRKRSFPFRFRCVFPSPKCKQHSRLRFRCACKSDHLQIEDLQPSSRPLWHMLLGLCRWPTWPSSCVPFFDACIPRRRLPFAVKTLSCKRTGAQRSRAPHVCASY